MTQDTSKQKEGWESKYWQKYGKLATHPFANGLKDFISSEIAQAKEEVVRDILKMDHWSTVYRQDIENYAKSKGIKLLTTNPE